MNTKAMAAYSALLAAILGLLTAFELWLTQTNIGNAVVIQWVKAIAEGVVPLGTAIGVVYVAFIQLRNAMTTGVNAGLKLAASGNMVDVHGNPISVGTGGATPPLPATSESAAKIVKDYGNETGEG